MVPATNREDSVPIATNIAASPVISNNTLYIVSDDGSLVAFKSDAPDTAAPSYTDLELPTGIVPNNASAPTTMAINGSPPLYFEATLEDEGSGVNPNSVKLLMDGQALPKRPDGDVNRDKAGWEYEASTGKLKYRTPTPTSASVVDALRDGRHTITLVATDWAGNTLNKTWTFTVDNSLKQLTRKTRGGSTTNKTNPGLGGSGGPGAGGKGG
jgi:hypothetical protein